MVMTKTEYLNFCDQIKKACENFHPKYLKNYMINTLLIKALKIMWLQKTKNTGYVIYRDYENYDGYAACIPQGENNTGYYYPVVAPIDCDWVQDILENKELILGYLDKDE